MATISEPGWDLSMAKTYRIGEAAKLLELKTYVLRFWETEFSQINPTRTETGQRLYSETDLELLRSIKHLLHERGLTIDGARKELARTTSTDCATDPELSEHVDPDFLHDIISELEAIRDSLDF